MSRKPYLITKGAADDIREIARYTAAQWGVAQSRAYIAQIEQAAHDVATAQDAFKNMSSILPGLRMQSAGRHYVFCLPQTDGPALILAVLHERMDIVARLKKRLSL